MVTKYSVNIKSQIFILKELSKRAVVFILGYYLFNYFLHWRHDVVIIIFFVVGYFVMEVLPSSILHYQYYRYNRHTTLIVNAINKSIVIQEKLEKYEIKVTQITNIFIALTVGTYEGSNGGWAAWDLYQYAYIDIQDGKRFVISCLLVNDLWKLFRELGIKATEVHLVFPTIRWSNKNIATA